MNKHTKYIYIPTTGNGNGTDLHTILGNEAQQSLRIESRRHAGDLSGAEEQRLEQGLQALAETVPAVVGGVDFAKAFVNKIP